MDQEDHVKDVNAMKTSIQMQLAIVIGITKMEFFFLENQSLFSLYDDFVNKQEFFFSFFISQQYWS